MEFGIHEGFKIRKAFSHMYLVFLKMQIFFPFLSNISHMHIALSTSDFKKALDVQLSEVRAKMINLYFFPFKDKCSSEADMDMGHVINTVLSCL